MAGLRVVVLKVGSDAASLCWPFAIGVHENVDTLHKTRAKLIQSPAKQAVCTKCASHQLTDVSCCSCCSGNNSCEGATAAASSLSSQPLLLQQTS